MSTVIEAQHETPGTWSAAPAVRVALAGCGAVGSALLRELDARRVTIERRHGRRVELTGVLVRDVAKRRAADVSTSLLRWSLAMRR